MTYDPIKSAKSLAEAYLAGGDSPPLRADTTPRLARAVLELCEQIERMQPVYSLAQRWCHRPESVLRQGTEVFQVDAELWIELRKRVAAAVLAESSDARGGHSEAGKTSDRTHACGRAPDSGEAGVVRNSHGILIRVGGHVRVLDRVPGWGGVLDRYGVVQAIHRDTLTLKAYVLTKRRDGLVNIEDLVDVRGDR